ncbi:hypothetical protein GOODEAATRI_033827 [Goodea atripinnis]|uniref:Uncharacterized protein n=1 Tax=Goodea atripinnis TaxID=208336 RepID=A0ABV0Q370_9TELE
MDEVLGQRSSTTPPVLIASIPEDTPGPSGAVGNQMEKEDSEPAGRGQKRKRDRDDGVDQGGHEGTENGQTVFHLRKNVTEIRCYIRNNIKFCSDCFLKFYGVLINFKIVFVTNVIYI